MVRVLQAIDSGSIHREFTVEQHVVDQLVAQQGYRLRQPGDYDQLLALDRGLVLEFIRTTQPDEWRKLVDQYSLTAETEFFKQLERNLRDNGTLWVLRNGIKLIPGIHFRLCYFQPASNLNPELVQRYEANILSVIRQVRYSLKNENCIDTVLFVNGLPIATIEFKNNLTGTTIKHAEKQYREDRSPAGEPLLTFARGALVHFAVDESNVSMTTRLRNGATRFLPFDRGRNGGAGNPDIPGEFRTAYLYADQPEGLAIFGRQTLLAILGKYLHIERSESGHESLIFPRFHQLDAVRALMAHARAHGSGQNYLVQHSAGSGKSNTIGWTAHQIVNLHDDRDQPLFDTAIVVTDRRILDSQLQNTIAQFEQVPGMVKKIEGTSAQLRAALKSNARIIVSTIQKFSTDNLQTLTGQSHKRFALIVDEAHSSQSGRTAQALANALTREETTSDDIEDAIAAQQKNRGPQPNISYIAFTATPRNVTLERFGLKGPDGLPHPFHLYSMRQAIREGFILDVLQNYMTYKAYYELEKAIASDPQFKTKKAQRKVARFAHLHPTAIGQKVEVMVEHFRKHVQPEMGGHAKAMVVTASREAAVRYYLGIKHYIAEQGYTGITPLVAFSGEVFVDGIRYTEPELTGFSESQLRDKFDTGDYQLLVVAEKYQTGFDQPKLCAMYVDKKLDGLQAVQTLSRLNRTAPGKQATYILDFQNAVEDIQEAFRPYYEATTIEEPTDLNQIYALEARIRKFAILDPGEIANFADYYYKHDLLPYDRSIMQHIVQAAANRFEQLPDEGRQEEFRQLLKSFQRFYAFVSQIAPLADTDLERLYTYSTWLVRLLPDRDNPPEIEITNDMLELHAFKIKQLTGAQDASLKPGDTVALPAIREFAARPYSAEEEKSLSEIIKSFNDRHGTRFTDADFLRYEQVNQEILDPAMIQMLRSNPRDVVYNAFREAFFAGAIKLFQRDAEMRSIVTSDPVARDNAIRFFFDRAFRQANDTPLPPSS